jgi:N-methylhydantoinase A/oxoprolinase/acetone carboxylase beta subunit
MVVTSGFRDVLLIGRGERRDIYSKDPDRPSPVLSRDEILEVDLRIDSHGGVISKVSDDELKALVDRIKRSGAKAIGVGILHSAQHPGEERELVEKMSGLTGLPVFGSAGLSPFPREYERWTLASIAAYLSGVLGDYIGELTDGFWDSKFSLMGSSGGLVSGSEALRNPAISILSGPAGGALAAMSLGCERVLALDMGGTSTDVTLLSGRLPKTREGSIDGLPVPLPTVDIHTIGAGGGSIVKIDSGGMLGLGPESAGADPGPACYGKGGPASLTDVILLTDRMFPKRFLGGRMKLYPEESLKALEAIRPKNLILDSMLDILLELTETRLVGALRRISVARGIDPSAGDGFTLVPFGGAGGFFAVECAENGIEGGHSSESGGSVFGAWSSACADCGGARAGDFVDGRIGCRAHKHRKGRVGRGNSSRVEELGRCRTGHVQRGGRDAISGSDSHAGDCFARHGPIRHAEEGFRVGIQVEVHISS